MGGGSGRPRLFLSPGSTWLLPLVRGQSLAGQGRAALWAGRAAGARLRLLSLAAARRRPLGPASAVPRPLWTGPCRVRIWRQTPGFTPRLCRVLAVWPWASTHPCKRSYFSMKRGKQQSCHEAQVQERGGNLWVGAWNQREPQTRPPPPPRLCASGPSDALLAFVPRLGPAHWRRVAPPQRGVLP